ncbi:MAG: hypothetical protein KatS3mg017_0894 [Fimbriimonadales bacterium]|nr:MAG: hypothetical protein KatS3mg017_0894 [Fimbriimonadales bacterium]
MVACGPDAVGRGAGATVAARRAHPANRAPAPRAQALNPPRRTFGNPRVDRNRCRPLDAYATANPSCFPPPKILWRGTGEPLRLPAEQVAHIHIEDETYRPAAEALAREWKRYGLRTRIQLGSPQAGVLFIGGSPDLQRKHPVPDQQGAYYLEVGSAGAKVIGRLPEGAFYGVQTLMQWFQPDSGALVAAPVRIVDYPPPEVAWRSPVRQHAARLPAAPD